MRLRSNRILRVRRHTGSYIAFAGRKQAFPWWKSTTMEFGMTPLVVQTFAAFVGFDRADTKHDVCVQAAGSRERRFEWVPHQVARIEQWAESLHRR